MHKNKKNTKAKTYTVLLVAGGTGGHIFPALSIYESLKNQDITVQVITDERGEEFVKKEQNIIYRKIVTTQIKRSSPYDFIVSSYKFIKGLLQSYKILKETSPKVVFGFGGYTSFTVLLVSQLLKIKTCIHEQNIVLGRSNRLLLKRVRKVLFGFQPKNFDEKSEYHIYGNPIRSKIEDYQKQPYILPKKDERFRVLILGGSQGAKIFSSLIPVALKKLPREFRQKLHIVQQCRAEDLKLVETLYHNTDIEITLSPFFDDIPKQIKEAHLIVCRAGASTITEINFIGRPALYIPLPTAMDNHQLYNAENIASQKGGWILEQKDATPEKTGETIKSLLENTKDLEKSAKNSYQLAMPNAKNDITKTIVTMAK